MPGHRASFRSLEPGGCSRNSGLAMHILAIVIVFAVREPLRLPSCSTSRPLAKMIAVGCVLVLAAALYVIALADFPHRVDGDAAAQANNAMEFLGASPPPIVGVGWFGRANLYYFLDSIALAMFGPTLFGMRIFGAIGGILAVLFTFLFARSVIGFRYAILAPGRNLGGGVARPLCTAFTRQLLRVSDHRSRQIATPWPPPMQSEARPLRALRLVISWSSVTTMRQPDPANGWPSAMAPPLMLMISSFQPISRLTAMACAAKASLISMASRSAACQPAFCSARREAATGPNPMSIGSTPAEA